MKERIGLQLYSLREFIGDDVEGALARVADCGFNSVEFAGYYGMEPEQLRALCLKHGLEPYSSHVGFDLLRDQLDEVVDTSRRLGLSYVICPGAKLETLEDVAEVAGVLNRAQAALAEHGIRCGYHNHEFEFKQIDGRYIFDHLIDAYDSDEMVAEVDTCWAAVGGADVTAWIDGLGSTAGPLHFKELSRDWKPGTRDNVDATIGEGVIDFGALLEVMRRNGTLERGVIVEQEGYTGEPYEALAASVEHIRSRWPRD